MSQITPLACVAAGIRTTDDLTELLNAKAEMDAMRAKLFALCDARGIRVSIASPPSMLLDILTGTQEAHSVAPAGAAPLSSAASAQTTAFDSSSATGSAWARLSAEQKRFGEVQMQKKTPEERERFAEEYFRSKGAVA